MSTTNTSSRWTTKRLVTMALFAAIICISAYISIPLPLPGAPHITLQNFVISLIALLFPALDAFLIIIVWMLLAIIGLPVFIGGGIGVPPMLETAKQLKGEPVLVMGYRDELFLTDEMKKAGELVIATEDGSAGTKGNVLDAIRENDLKADMIFACGPKPMLRALKAYGLANNIPCYVSMEERMACGVGACLGCVCQSTEVDDHSQVKNKRVCKDGPVFLSTEVEL